MTKGTKRDKGASVGLNCPKRPGKNAKVYLGSEELAAICSKPGRIPTKEEYLTDRGVINKNRSWSDSAARI